MIKIKNIKIGRDYKKIFSVAEIGVNHNGSLKKSYRLIDCAVKSGFDAVKFQTFDLDNMLLPNTKLATYQKKTKFLNMKEMLKKISLTKADFSKINLYCKKKKIIFLSTPFDVKSAEFLNSLHIPLFKISSGDLDNFLLLKKIKSFKKPIIISTGMATLKDIKKTVKFLKLKKNRLVIMHCISEYPTKLDESQLGFIKELKKLKYTVGFSDHTVGFAASIASVALGAKIIEKHITLDNNMKGPDHSSSMNVKFLKDFINMINSLAKSVNIKNKFITKEERANAKVAKKALYYNKNLQKFHKITFDDLISLRPFNNGISPSNYKILIGKRIKKNIKKFQNIKTTDLI